MQHDYKARKQEFPIMPLDERLLSKTIKNHISKTRDGNGQTREHRFKN